MAHSGKRHNGSVYSSLAAGGGNHYGVSLRWRWDEGRGLTLSRATAKVTQTGNYDMAELVITAI